MTHTLHYKVSIVGALISSIAFTALAVFAIAPGETLDPVADPNITCAGPTDVTCIINPYDGLDPNGVLYLDGNGQLTTVSDFIKDESGFYVGSEVSPGVISGLKIGELVIPDSFGFPALPGVGMEMISDEFHGLMGFLDVGGSGGFGILTQDQSTGIQTSLLMDNFGVDFAMFMDNGDTIGNVGTSPTGASLGWRESNNHYQLRLNNSGLQYIFGWNENAPEDYYTFPNAVAGVGQVLTDVNGDGILSWESGGSSPISIGTSGTTIYSDGINAGQGDTAAGGNVFLGNHAGSGATNASGSNFIGFFSGADADNAFYSNFLGYNAGLQAKFANNSIFIGYQAGMTDFASGSTLSNNSIFIGNNAGFQSGDLGLDNSGGGTSILIGDNTSTGGFSNSIAIGAGATNTATNQFMIGSTSTPIVEMVIVLDGIGGECLINNTGANCSSDENLKNSIQPLSSTLDTLRNIEPIRYLWNSTDQPAIGFSAQNVQTYYPELVKEGSQGYLMMNYANMTPILTKAIQELDLKISLLESQTESSGGFSLASIHTVIKNLLGDISNGIQNIFTKKITTEELCVGNTCISESELIEVLELRNGLQSNTGITQQVESGQQDNNEESGVQDDESIDEITEDVQKNASDSSEPDDESLKNDAPIEEFSDQDPVDGSVMNSENEAENIEESVAGVDE